MTISSLLAITVVSLVIGLITPLSSVSGNAKDLSVTDPTTQLSFTFPMAR